jgi:hypothetical protein
MTNRYKGDLADRAVLQARHAGRRRRRCWETSCAGWPPSSVSVVCSSCSARTASRASSRSRWKPGSMTIIQAPHLNLHWGDELEAEGLPVPIIHAPPVNRWRERAWRRGAVLGARTVARSKRSSFAPYLSLFRASSSRRFGLCTRSSLPSPESPIPRKRGATGSCAIPSGTGRADGVVEMSGRLVRETKNLLATGGPTASSRTRSRRWG